MVRFPMLDVVESLRILCGRLRGVYLPTAVPALVVMLHEGQFLSM
jgi:hypothetical protein